VKITLTWLIKAEEPDLQLILEPEEPARGERELTRRPITHVRDAGFVIDETDRLRAGMIERLVARKP
jgi:hypothetical protein